MLGLSHLVCVSLTQQDRRNYQNVPSVERALFALGIPQTDSLYGSLTYCAFEMQLFISMLCLKDEDLQKAINDEDNVADADKA